jgi:hypothetical protein
VRIRRAEFLAAARDVSYVPLRFLSTKNTGWHNPILYNPIEGIYNYSRIGFSDEGGWKDELGGHRNQVE